MIAGLWGFRGKLSLGHGDQTPREFLHALKRRGLRRIFRRSLGGVTHRFLRLPRWWCGLLLRSRRSGQQVAPDEILVGQPLADDVASHCDEPLGVATLAIIEPDGLLVQVAQHMERVNADVGALDGALETAPEVLQAIGVDLAPHVLDGVVDEVVPELLAQADVGAVRR